MLNQQKWTKVLLGSAVVLSLALGGTAVFAQTAEPTASAPTAEKSEGEHGQRGNRGNKIDDNEFLADALGITVEELQAAKDAVRSANEGTRPDKEARIQLLADELGIDVATLQAAKDEAHATAIVQAVADGTISAEEAALMEAKRALRDYIDRDAIMATVLGVSVEELQAAKEAGTVDELVDASGLEREEIRDAVDAAKETAVQEAIADGVLTAEQAEQLQEMRGSGGKHGGNSRGGNSRGGNGNGGHGPRGNGNPPPAPTGNNA